MLRWPTCSVLAVSILALCTPSDAEDAQALYAAAVASLDTASTETSIEAFKAVVDADDSFAPAHHELAKLFMSLGNPQDRLRAERALTRAIKLDTDNLDYRMTLGELLWAQGKWEASAHLYSKLLEANPDNARAAYQVGYRALKEFLKYKDMEDYERGVRFTWDHFAVKDRDIAVERFAEAIRLDPSFRDPYYQLGLIFYESDEFGKLIEISKALLKQDPEAKDAYLFCGLGYQMVFDQEQAFDYYQEAIKRMSGQERAVMESVEHVVSKEEKGTMQTAGAACDRFWRQQDPLFLTEFNERKMEHYGRVAYANLAYSRPSKGLAGWQTDKGSTHIRFGKPLHRRVQRPEVSDTGRMIQAHEERWFFEGMVLTFRNWDGLDGWNFQTMNRPGETPRTNIMEQEARYVDPYQYQRYSLPHMLAAFREGDRTRIELAVAIPEERLDPYEPELEVGFFLFDSDWEPVLREVVEGPETTPLSVETLEDPYLMLQKTLYAEPGEYAVVTEVREKIEGSIGSFQEERIFRSAGEGMDVSDLILASNIETDDPFPESRDQLRIVPNPLRSYRASDPVFVYLEVYDLVRDDFGRTAYDISYRVGWPQDPSSVEPGLFAAIDAFDAESFLEIEERSALGTLRQDGEDFVAGYEVSYVLPERNRAQEALRDEIEKGKGVETTVTARYEGNRVNDLTFLQIDISQVPPGVHELTVVVEDVNGGGEEVRRVLFKVEE